MPMKHTFFLMVLAGVALQSTWASDKTETGDGGLLPPPPPGPFMSAGEGRNAPENVPGMHPFGFPEPGRGEMPPIEAVPWDWPKDEFHAPVDMPTPPEFPAWDNQAMPPMPQGMGNYPVMGEMMPPPEFPAWTDQGMPAMPPMNQDWPEMGSRSAGMPPMYEFTPPPEYPGYQRPPMPRGYLAPPQGYRHEGPPGWPGPTYGASSYAE